MYICRWSWTLCVFYVRAWLVSVELCAKCEVHPCCCFSCCFSLASREPPPSPSTNKKRKHITDRDRVMRMKERTGRGHTCYVHVHQHISIHNRNTYMYVVCKLSASCTYLLHSIVTVKCVCVFRAFGRASLQTDIFSGHTKPTTKQRRARRQHKTLNTTVSTQTQRSQRSATLVGVFYNVNIANTYVSDS